MLVSAQRLGAKEATDAIDNESPFSQTNAGVGIFATNARYPHQLSSVRRYMSSHPQPLRIYFPIPSTDTRIHVSAPRHPAQRTIGCCDTDPIRTYGTAQLTQ